jgi:hypothetical protein
MDKLNAAKLALKQLADSIEPVLRSKTAKVLPTNEQAIREMLQSKADEAAEGIRSGGGFSLDPRTGNMVELGSQRGFMMSPIENDAAVQIPFREDISGSDLLNALPESYIQRLQKGGYLGGWVDDGQVYLDPAERFATKLGSLRSGLKTGQLSGADLSKSYEAGPFYDVNSEAYKELLKQRALQALAATGGLGAAGTAGALVQD